MKPIGERGSSSLLYYYLKKKMERKIKGNV
jgi:hypothetical protein